MILTCIHGKFNTVSRKNAGAIVSGNSVYVSETAFKKYANYKNFWIFSNDSDTNVGTIIENNNVVNYTRYVATQSSNLNVRSSPSGTKVSSLSKGTKVNVVEVSGDWSRINSPVQGWVSTQYLSASTVQFLNSLNGYTIGTYRVNTNIHVRTGPGISYNSKKYKQLTSNARSQNKKLGNYYYNGYKEGVTCTVTHISGNWGKTASGWICLDYCKKI